MPSVFALRAVIAEGHSDEVGVVDGSLRFKFI
jgi:hypothetical protein